MEFAELMAGLASELGLSPFAADPAGYYALEVDGMALMLFPAPGGVALLGHVGVVDPTDTDRLRQLLAGNGMPARGAHLGLDANRNVIAIQWLPAGELDHVTFLKEIGHFANYLESWCDYLNGNAMPRPAREQAQ